MELESVGLAKSFSDIDELAVKRRFADCRHENEPGCAVRSPISDGR